jgi:hypothetical protein
MQLSVTLMKWDAEQCPAPICEAALQARTPPMEPEDIGRLKLVVNSVRELERQLPYTVKCECGEKNLEAVDCEKCGVHHTRSAANVTD